MQTPAPAQFFPIVGSQSLPRFEAEPQTLKLPLVVVTVLQMLNWSAVAHAFASDWHEM
jgi:hypothetical protein